MRISSASSLSGCLHQNLVGPLAQDLCTRISCARLISLAGSLHQDLCRSTCRRPPSRLRKRNVTSVPRDGHARSAQRVALGNQKMQLYQHFAQWTRTIFAKGCTSKTQKLQPLPGNEPQNIGSMVLCGAGRAGCIRAGNFRKNIVLIYSPAIGISFLETYFWTMFGCVLASLPWGLAFWRRFCF